MRTAVILFPALLLIAACDDDSNAQLGNDAPPAAALTPGMDAENLDVQLQTLEAEIGRALDGESGRLLTAEAITDRLIHADRSVDWLSPGYDVEARLRQIQSMADRIVAQLRRGMDLETVREEVAVMRVAVQDVQRQLAMPGGGDAPPALDSLLQQDPLRDVEAPSARANVDDDEDERELPEIGPQARPGRTGPLGTPVRNDDTPGP